MTSHVWLNNSYMPYDNFSTSVRQFGTVVANGPTHSICYNKKTVKYCMHSYVTYLLGQPLYGHSVIFFLIETSIYNLVLALSLDGF